MEKDPPRWCSSGRVSSGTPPLISSPPNTDVPPTTPREHADAHSAAKELVRRRKEREQADAAVERERVQIADGDIEQIGYQDGRPADEPLSPLKAARDLADFRTRMADAPSRQFVLATAARNGSTVPPSSKRSPSVRASSSPCLSHDIVAHETTHALRDGCTNSIKRPAMSMFWRSMKGSPTSSQCFSVPLSRNCSVLDDWDQPALGDAVVRTVSDRFAPDPALRTDRGARTRPEHPCSGPDHSISVPELIPEQIRIARHSGKAGEAAQQGLD